MNKTRKEDPYRITISEKPKIVITEKLQKQIDYLHDKYDVEWSGELITREEGSINDIDNWKIIAEDIYLADIGTSGYTKYDVGDDSWKEEDILTMYEQFPGLMEGTHKNQHIHSHHSMGAFFSAVDDDQLENRAETSNYVIMLIVDYRRTYCAQVAFRAKKKTDGECSIQMANDGDNSYKGMTIRESKEDDVLVVIDCDVEYEKEEEGSESDFVKRCRKVKEDKLSYTYTRLPEKNENTGSKYVQGNLYGSWTEGYKRSHSNGKSVMEMTDEEWEDFNTEELETNGERYVKKEFDSRDCKIFLNAMIDKAITVNTKFPMERLRNMTDPEKSSFIERMNNDIYEYYNELFKDNNSDNYISFLNSLGNFISSYVSMNPMFSEMMEIIEEEIENATEELYEATNNKQ